MIQKMIHPLPTFPPKIFTSKNLPPCCLPNKKDTLRGAFMPQNPSKGKWQKRTLSNLRLLLLLFSINNNLYFSRKRTNFFYTMCITPNCDYVVVILPKDVWEIKVQVDYETRRDYNFWFCFLMPNIVWSFGFCKSWVFQFLTFNICTSNSCLWPTIVIYGLMIIVFCSLVVWVWIH